MARDFGLEELIREHLGQKRGLSEKPMFGGLAWLLNGNLVCGAREDGMLARLGKGSDGWALATPGITSLVMRGRAMDGWVRASADAFGDDAVRHRLLSSALTFVRTLPPK